MIKLPEFNLALWAIESPASDKSPTHQGTYTDPQGRKWPVVGWYKEDPGVTANGKQRPNLGVKIDESKFKYAMQSQHEDRQGENVVDNPNARVTDEQIAKLDELETRLDAKLAMLQRFEELEAQEAAEAAKVAS